MRLININPPSLIGSVLLQKIKTMDQVIKFLLQPAVNLPISVGFYTRLKLLQKQYSIKNKEYEIRTINIYKTFSSAFYRSDHYGTNLSPFLFNGYTNLNVTKFPLKIQLQLHSVSIISIIKQIILSNNSRLNVQIRITHHSISTY